MSDSFVFYRSFLDAVKEIPADSKLPVLLAICGYGLDGEIPDGLNEYERGMLALIKPNIDHAQEKHRKAVENGKRGAEFGILGGRPRKTPKNPDETPKNPDETPFNPLDVDVNKNANADADVNKNVNADVKVDEEGERDVNIRPPAFIPPTVSEVEAFRGEKGLVFDAEQFHAYYAARGWTVGNGAKMKDWHAACISWARRERNFSREDQGGNGNDYLAAVIRGEIANDNKFGADGIFDTTGHLLQPPYNK